MRISKSCIRPSRSCSRFSCAMRDVLAGPLQLALDLRARSAASWRPRERRGAGPARYSPPARQSRPSDAARGVPPAASASSSAPRRLRRLGPVPTPSKPLAQLLDLAGRDGGSISRRRSSRSRAMAWRTRASARGDTMFLAGDLIEMRERDVELAHRPERAGHPPHLMRGRDPGRGRCTDARSTGSASRRRRVATRA